MDSYGHLRCGFGEKPGPAGRSCWGHLLVRKKTAWGRAALAKLGDQPDRSQLLFSCRLPASLVGNKSPLGL